MLYRLIAPSWLIEQDTAKHKVLEGEFNEEQISFYNSMGYNIYFLPNSCSIAPTDRPVDGRDIDIFSYVFVDFDLKNDTIYGSKMSFIGTIYEFELKPSFIVDSGNGVHVYWRVSDLDAMTYLKIQRRLIRQFHTDEAIAKIFQLMRVPNTLNTKIKDEPKPCEIIDSNDNVYTVEDFDKFLAPLTLQDAEYCERHFNTTYKIIIKNSCISDKIPLKFADLLRHNKEVSSIWAGGLDDRSKGDYRLGHIMFASGLTKEEAISVLLNSPKALSRTEEHRINYATNIVDKIWVQDKSETSTLSRSVSQILNRPTDTIKGTRFQCYRWIDDTAYGFRLGHVMGLIAGSGVGKTSVALNLFLGFVESNPDYDHFFVSLEQPATEIADRWKTLCGEKPELHDRVHIIDNHNEDGSFRHLSLDQIQDYIIQFQTNSQRKIGCVVIDHIGILNKKTKDGENQGIIDICHKMKSFALSTKTFLIMQSQSSREKAGIGDLEIGKDAAYGTVFFESYCDYVVCIWQPLKRCYSESGCPTITAFKFGKIRHKNQKLDVIKEDVCYKMFFEPTLGKLREITQDEEKSFTFFLNRATNKRKQDRKTDLVEYKSVKGDTVAKILE